MTKPQYVDNIPKAVCGRVGDIIASKDERGVAEYLNQELGMFSLHVFAASHAS